MRNVSFSCTRGSDGSKEGGRALGIRSAHHDARAFGRQAGAQVAGESGPEYNGVHAAVPQPTRDEFGLECSDRGYLDEVVVRIHRPRLAVRSVTVQTPRRLLREFGNQRGSAVGALDNS